MEPEINKSYSRIVSLVILHANRFRLASFSAENIDEKSINDLGREMIDLFELRSAELKKKTPPAGSSASSDWHAGTTARQRGRR